MKINELMEKIGNVDIEQTITKTANNWLDKRASIALVAKDVKTIASLFTTAAASKTDIQPETNDTVTIKPETNETVTIKPETETRISVQPSKIAAAMAITDIIALVSVEAIKSEAKVKAEAEAAKKAEAKAKAEAEAEAAKKAEAEAEAKAADEAFKLYVIQELAKIKHVSEDTRKNTRSSNNWKNNTAKDIQKK